MPGDDIGICVTAAGDEGQPAVLHIGDGAVLTAQSAVSHDVPAGAMYSGSPAFENKLWLRSTGVYRRLPELQSAVRALQTAIDRLRAAHGA